MKPVALVVWLWVNAIQGQCFSSPNLTVTERAQPFGSTSRVAARGSRARGVRLIATGNARPRLPWLLSWDQRHGISAYIGALSSAHTLRQESMIRGIRLPARSCEFSDAAQAHRGG